MFKIISLIALFGENIVEKVEKIYKKNNNQLLIEDLKNYMKNNNLKYNYKKVILFGSRANNTYNDNSDIDLLVEFDNTKATLFSMAKLVNNISEKFNLKVDIIPYSYDTNGLKLRIDKEIPIYG